MKKKIIIMLSVLALTASSFFYSCGDKPAETVDAGDSVEQGETASGNAAGSAVTNTAPDFTVKDSDDNNVKLSDKFGKPIIVNMWATWCGPCLAELPAFNKLAQTYKDDITFMMVNLTDGSYDTVDAVKEFADNNGYTFPVYYDTEANASNAYSVFSIPLTIFIDENGNVKEQHTGTMSEEVLQGYIDDLLKK
ncbi:MAG: TlpA family protein disulfide reductase [Clostridiales bacterium]|jgi:thiol-disulfide isomerase/thioredoxin|nr:TlpA family protein disulfide reductase [Clostridiales bacterium]